ncbi:hypothetical protein OUZ56_014442 [Daphnia magna]|uniref:Uncharacterized protein n=1 Tax=Daphnia magna TaxID=35525 RepID=A0ABR0AJS3_9CRUS|nr:hypothetical protein OUZ56_014442 [Daphnia magna]
MFGLSITIGDLECFSILFIRQNVVKRQQQTQSRCVCAYKCQSQKNKLRYFCFATQSVFGTLPRRKLLILTLAHTMKRLFLPSASVASSMKLIEEVNSSLLNANNRFISKTVSRPYSAATLWVMLPTRNDKKNKIQNYGASSILKMEWPKSEERLVTV